MPCFPRACTQCWETRRDLQLHLHQLRPTGEHTFAWADAKGKGVPTSMSTMAAVAGKPKFTPAAYEPGVPKAFRNVLNEVIARECAGTAANRQHASIFAAPTTEATVAAVPATARPVPSCPCAFTPPSPTPSSCRSARARSWTWWHDPRLRGGRNRLNRRRRRKGGPRDPELPALKRQAWSP